MGGNGGKPPIGNPDDRERVLAEETGRQEGNPVAQEHGDQSNTEEN